jgi:hypothetical protein
MRSVRSSGGISRSKGTTGSARARRSGWRPRTIRNLALDGHRVPRAGDEIVHRHEHLDQIAERPELRAQETGQLPEHSQRFALFFRFRLAQGVAQLDRLGWLDEERGGAAGLVVDDAGRARPRIPPHRNDVPACADGHAAVGGGRAGIEPAEERLELPEEPGACGVHVAASGGQARAGRVEQRAVFIDRLLEAALDAGVERLPVELCRKRRIIGDPPEVGVHLPRGDEHPAHVGELAPFEYAALDAKAAEHADDVGNRFGEQAVATPEESGHLSDSGQLDGYPGEIACRTPPEHARLAQRSGRVRRDEVEHERELDGLERVGARLSRQERRGAALRLGRHPVNGDRIRLRHQLA